jgi:hypothetical protein
MGGGLQYYSTAQTCVHSTQLAEPEASPKHFPRALHTCVCMSLPVTMLPTVRRAGTRTAAEVCLQDTGQNATCWFACNIELQGAWPTCICWLQCFSSPGSHSQEQLSEPAADTSFNDLVDAIIVTI